MGSGRLSVGLEGCLGGSVTWENHVGGYDRWVGRSGV